MWLEYRKSASISILRVKIGLVSSTTATPLGHVTIFIRRLYFSRVTIQCIHRRAPGSRPLRLVIGVVLVVALRCFRRLTRPTEQNLTHARGGPRLLICSRYPLEYFEGSIADRHPFLLPLADLVDGAYDALDVLLGPTTSLRAHRSRHNWRIKKWALP